MKLVVALILCLVPLSSSADGEVCRYDPNDDEADPAHLKMQLCKLTKLVNQLSTKVDKLSNKPLPTTRPPIPDDEAVPAHLKMQLCKLTKLVNQLSTKVDKLSNKPPPTTRPPIPENLSSCKAIKAHASWVTQSKAYTLTVSGRRFQAYCHMSALSGCGAGPWTMVMKINGNSRTFHWSSAYWGNTGDYNINGGKTGFNDKETKLPTYWGTPFSRLCVGMKVGDGPVRWIQINRGASSLHALIHHGRYTATHVGRERWRSLIPESSLQPYCNREGFNVQAENPPAAKARIGIIASDPDHPVCKSAGSFIGFGTSYPASRLMDSDSCGNESIFNGDRGTKHIKAFGYIMVQ